MLSLYLLTPDWRGVLQSDFFPSSQIVSEATFSLHDPSLSFAFFPQSPGIRQAGLLLLVVMVYLFCFSSLFYSWFLQVLLKPDDAGMGLSFFSPYGTSPTLQGSMSGR